MVRTIRKETSDPSLLDIDYWSRSFLALAYPVSWTVMISAGMAIFLYDLYMEPNMFEEAGLIVSSKDSDHDSIMKMTWETLKIALIVVAFFALATCLLVALVYCGLMKCLYVYLAFTVFSVFSLLNLSILSMIIAQLNLPIDWITISLYTYNGLAVAMLSMFWLSPDSVKQVITIYQCILMILYILKIAPEWIAWAILPLLALWDILAVLLPFGPLYLLINLLEERRLKVPAMMIYTTGLWLSSETNNIDEVNSSQKTQPIILQCSSMNFIFFSTQTLETIGEYSATMQYVRNTNASSDESSSTKRKARKSMLGLGDFIFYSILLAKTVFTSQYNLFSIIIVYLCIIMGMLATTLILIVLHRPLPALPISLFLGLLFFFHYQYIGDEFALALRLPTGPVFI